MERGQNPASALVTAAHAALPHALVPIVSVRTVLSNRPMKRKQNKALLQLKKLLRSKRRNAVAKIANARPALAAPRWLQNPVVARTANVKIATVVRKYNYSPAVVKTANAKTAAVAQTVL